MNTQLDWLPRDDESMAQAVLGVPQKNR